MPFVPQNAVRDILQEYTIRNYISLSTNDRIVIEPASFSSSRDGLRVKLHQGTLATHHVLLTYQALSEHSRYTLLVNGYGTRGYFYPEVVDIINSHVLNRLTNNEWKLLYTRDMNFLQNKFGQTLPIKDNRRRIFNYVEPLHTSVREPWYNPRPMRESTVVSSRPTYEINISPLTQGVSGPDVCTQEGEFSPDAAFLVEEIDQ